MSEAMQNVVACLETDGRNLWERLYDLSRDELIQLFKELDYAICLKCGTVEKLQLYTKAAENLKDFYQDDEL